MSDDSPRPYSSLITLFREGWEVRLVVGTAAARAGQRAWVAGVLVALPIMLAALAYQERGPGLVALAGSSVLAVLAVLRPVAGLGALLTVLPFVAFARRALYLVGPYTPYDPLLLVAPALTGCLVVRLLLVDKAALRRAPG